jgi:type I restriction enzyme R subunit
MQQIVDYKTDPGNGYGKTLCFISSSSSAIVLIPGTSLTIMHDISALMPMTLPAVYQFASEDNKKITLLEIFADKFLAKCTLGK